MPNVFEAEVSKSAQLLGLYYLKLSPPRGAGFYATSPYDSLIIHSGHAIALELKSQRLQGSFPLGNIADHQFAGLNRMLSLGCAAYLIFNFRRKHTGKKIVNSNVAYALHFENWTRLLEEIPLHHGKVRHSIPFDLFETSRLFIPLPRINIAVNGKSYRVWDLRILI